VPAGDPPGPHPAHEQQEIPSMRQPRTNRALVFTLGAAIVLGGAGASEARRGSDQIVIAHRGASGYLPEHTLPAYTLAYAMGADYIEPDLVMSSDGVLIALHDIHLEATTNVEEVFPERARGDGRWYAADFTLAEIRTLEAHERANADGSPVFPERFRIDSKGFQVPTLREVIELVQELNRITGCSVGIYPETKDPAFHDAAELPMEEELLAILAEYGYEGRDAPVFIQSFDPNNLQELRFVLGTELPLVQLISGGAEQDALVTPEGIEFIATYADGIGPSKDRIEDEDGNSVDNNGLVRMAHAHGLLVHPYTFRADALPPAYDDFEEELRRFYFRYGVDGLFTDHPNLAVEVAKPWFYGHSKIKEQRSCRL
jgi:glycerophosphoryl diester phosphodiesterase